MVLAVTGAIFASAWGLFSGQSGETEFTQSMHDIESLIQSYSTEVLSGALPSGQSYACSAATGRPVLDTNNQAGIGTNEDCVFLGRAIQVTDQSGDISIYTVLGDRTQHNGSTDTGVPATTLSQADPEITLDTNGGNVWLRAYTLQGGATVKSSTIDSASGQYPLIGFYNNLTRSGASTSLTAEGYQLTTNVKSCIENDPTCQPQAVAQWNLCMSDANGKTTAQLVTNVLPSGVTTKLNFVSC